MAGKQKKCLVKRRKPMIRSRRFLAIFMCLTLITGVFSGIAPTGRKTAKAATGQAVTTATAGNAASGVEITHSVLMPSSGGKTATITVELDSKLHIKKQSDTVFVVDCSATADLERQKEVLKSLASMILKDSNCGANRFGLVGFSNDAQIMAEFTGDYDTFVAAVDRCQAQGNINYYAGMKLAGELLADKGAESSKNSMVVVGRGVCNMNSTKAIRLADELRGKYEVYGLCANAGADDSSSFLRQIAGDNLLQLGNGTDGFGDSPACLAARLVDSPLYQNLTAEGSLADGFVQRSLENCLYEPGFNGEAAADFTEGRLKVTVPEFYAGESLRITLTADIRDRLATGIIPVTGAIRLYADNLAEVSADALSIERSGYTVTYDANGGSGSVPLDNNYYEEGTEVSVKAKPADLNKDGANFSGWGLSIGSAPADGSFTMPANNVSVKALWGRAYIQKKTNTVIPEPTRRMKCQKDIELTDSFYKYKTSIRSIIFLDTNKGDMPAGGDEWDITDTHFGRAGSVMAAAVKDDGTQLYDLYIGAKGGVEAPKNSSYLFAGFSELTEIRGMECFHTSNVTNMKGMFQSCENLTMLDVSNFDTSQVTDMSYMFYECSGLTELAWDVTKFNTSNVMNMGGMFQSCKNLTALDVSKFDTSKVTSMYRMFFNCSKLTTLDVGNFDTSNVKSISEMFSLCSKLTTLDVGNFDTSNVKSMSEMFFACSGLTALDVSKFDTSNMENMSGMFSGCSGLTALDVTKFNTSNVTNMSEMFKSCKNLTALNVSNFDTSKVTDMSKMFYECSGLTALTWDATKFKTSSVTNMSKMFYCCNNLTTLDVSGFNTAKVKDMSGMFQSCKNLTTLDVTNFDTSSVTSMEYMFSGCSGLTELAWNVNNFNTFNVTDMDWMFLSCSALQALDISGFKTSNVTSMTGMFYGCSGLTKLNVSNIDTSKVKYMNSMFYECSSLTELNVSSFDTSSVTNMSYMFSGCSSLTKLDVSNFNTSNVTGMGGMFSRCSGLTELNVSNFDTSNVTDMGGVSRDQHNSLTDKGGMFSGCSGLTELNVSNFKTSKVTDMACMFYRCSGLTTLTWDVTNFNTSKVTDMSYMFSGCSSLTALTLNETNFDTSSVTNMVSMFSRCSGLTKLDVGNLNTGNVTNMNSMFSGCSGLTELNVSNIDTSKVKSMNSMFYECSSLTELNVSNFDTSNVTNMNSMFFGCSGLTTLDVGSFVTSKVYYMKYIFKDCTKLTDIGTKELRISTANSVYIDDWNLNTKLPDDIKIIKGDGTQIWPKSTVNSLRSAFMKEVTITGEAAAFSAGNKTEEETEPCGTEPCVTEDVVQYSGITAVRSVPSSNALVDAREKGGMIEGGELTAGQEVEYVLDLQYIGDEGGKSGELLVTDKIPEGMTYKADSLVVSGVARIDGGRGGLSGTVTKQPEVKNGILSFAVEGLSAGAKLTVTYTCTAPATEPAEYTEYINRATVNDSGLIDESDPVRHYMHTRPDTFYNITYQYDGALPDGAAVPGSESVAEGKSVTLPTPQERGWTFNGWKAGETVVSGSYTPTQDTVLVGTWTKVQEPKYIKIQYQFSGDVPGNASFILADIKEDAVEKAGVNERVSLPDKPELPAGYAGFEWVLPQGVEADENGWYNVGESGRFDDDTIVVTGKWTKKQYQVTYQYDGTIPSGVAAVPARKGYKWGEKVSLAAAPADTATHTFGRWTGVSANAAGQFEMPMADITITGRWMEKSIKVNPNGGLWNGNGDETVYSYQTYLQDKDSGSFPDANRENYVFKGWEESEDSEGSFVKVLTAKWTAISYPISYVLDGGTADRNPKSYTIESDTITLDNPEKTGYTFTGWSGTGLTGDDNKKVTIAQGSIGERSYTAHWTINTYTVTLGSGEGYTIETVDNSASPVNYGGSYSFRITVAPGYDASAMKVMVNGSEVSLNGTKEYTIENITENKEVTVTGVADKEVPDVTIAMAGRTWTSLLDSLSFNLFYKENQTVTITAADQGSGVKKVWYYLADEGMTAEGVKQITGWQEYNASFSISEEKNYVIYVKAEDEAGNISYANSDGFVLDKTAPKIEIAEITEEGVCCEVAKVTVTEKNLKEITVNGSPVTLVSDNSITLTEKGEQTITVTDKAGNESSRKVTVSAHDWSGSWVVKSEPTATEDGVKETACTRGCGAKMLRTIPAAEDGEVWSGVITSEGVEIVGCSGSDTAVGVPSEIDGRPVTAISKDAFAGHTEIISVTVSVSVTSIGENAFADCTGLTTIMIPEGLDTTKAGITDTAAKITYKVENGKIIITSVTPGTDRDGGKKPVTIPETIGGKKPEIPDAVKEEMKNIPHEHRGGTATCTQKAVCEICGGEHGGFAGHTLAKTEGEKPTCTADGRIDYWTCSECGKIFSDENGTQEITAEEVKLAALGHDWSGSWVVKNEPTATKDGVEETACTHGCGEKMLRTIPAAEDGEVWSGIITSDGVEIVGCSGSDMTVEVPSEIGGRPVTAIGENVFDGHTEITSVTIPVSVTAIGEGAFADCTGLSTIMIPEGLDTTKAGITDTAAKITYRVDENGKIIITSVTPGTDRDGGKKPVTLPETIGGKKPEIPDDVKETMKNIPHEHRGGTATCIQKAVCEICGGEHGDFAGHTFPEQWTVEKEATESESGRQYKICEKCGAKLYRITDPLGTPADPNAGEIEKEVEVLPGAPDTVLNNSKEELAESVLTPEEIAEVDSGTNAKIWLEVAPDVKIAEEAKAQVQKAAEESVGAGTEVTYFDISLFKQVGGGEKKAIHEPGRAVSVTIVIPEKLRNKDTRMVRNYQIIRLHDGKTDIIDGTYKEESAEFTFETDKFSVYAICYKDSPKQATPETPTPTPGGTTEPETPTPTPGGKAEPGTQISALDESGQTGNEIEKRKDLSILLATGKQKGSAGIKLTWLKWKDASGYEVYWSYCDGKKNYMKLKTVKAKRTYTHKKLKKERAYKYYIAAYKMVDGMKKYVAKSPVIHVAMKYEKRTNAKKITANTAKVILSLTNNKEYKKTFKIRVKVKKEDSKKKLLAHTAELRYYTDDRKVVKVSRTGKITARGRGICTVYVIANNGVCKKITVTVK